MRRTAFSVVIATFVVCGCRNNSGVPSYWQPWITEPGGNQSWVWKTYDSRDDCFHATEFAIEKGEYSRGPRDCVFVSQILPYSILINLLHGVHGVKCIAKYYDPSRKQRYDAVLDAYPATEATDWYCVWKF
jgi:hypothetical protein